MYILGDILITVANVLHIIFSLYQWIIIGAVIISWVRPAPSNEIIRTILIVISRLTEPFFYQIRKRIPSALMSSGLDFTPLIAWIIVFAADMLFYRVLINTGVRLSMGVVNQNPGQDIPQL